jgi:hypothetical protein
LTHSLLLLLLRERKKDRQTDRQTDRAVLETLIVQEEEEEEEERRGRDSQVRSVLGR